MAKARTMSDAAYSEAVTPKDGDERLRLANTVSSTALTASAVVSTTIHHSSPRGDDHERSVGISSSEEPAAPASSSSSVALRDLYRYASPCDCVLLWIGLFMMLVNGAMYPFMAILFGQAISSFQPLDMDKIERVALAYFAIAVALFVTDYVAHVCLETAAQKQMHALRIHVFRHVIYQDIAWFETAQEKGNASISHLSMTTTKIKDGIGVKLGEAVRCVAQFATGYAIGFAYHWQVSIVMASIMPFMALSLSWIIKTLRQRTAFSMKKYAEAGVIAEETLRSLRTVASFNGEQRAVEKYIEKATSAEAENVKLARVLSIVLGIFFGTIWVTYAVGLWFGASVVANAGETDPRTVFSAFYGILIGTISLAQISPNIAAIYTAKAAAASLFKLLNEPTKVNAESLQGFVPRETCKGQIQIVDVDFAYPMRPETLVLKKYSLTIHAGETVAFVGPSGGGKSTLMALLQRYYEPDAGQILLDGKEIQSLQLKWLRRQIGLVSQEPVLFAATIFENIAASLDYEYEHEADINVVMRQVEGAARQANAHDFIVALPHGYHTHVGEKGVALSGGQKQRIAIARALVRNPRILILDEATSALDTESEAMIQGALNNIITRANRTTLVIAHRLSTIKRADRICVVAGGEIVESGTHEELIRRPNGKFQELVARAHFDSTTMQQRNASLVWCDSLTDVLSSQRGSSMAMLAARPTDAAIFDSKRSDFTVINSQYQRETSGIAERGAVGDLPAPPHEDDADAGSQPVARELTTKALVRRLMHHNHQERHLFVVGLLAAAMNGLSFPASAILLSAIVSTMVNKYASFQVSQDQSVLDVMYDEVWHLSTAYIAGAVALVLVTFAQSYAFKFMAEKLVTRLRYLHFRALCSQDMSFFDDTKHGSGALASDLATMPTKAAILAGDTPGRITQAITTFIAALLVSFLMGSWILSLIMCVVFPMLILSNLIRTKTMKASDSKNENGDEHTARANTLASEAVAHIRTVASFGLESRLVDEYRQLSLAPIQATARHAHTNGLALGFSSFSTFAAYALVFWIGGLLVENQQITFSQLIRSLMAIMISASGIGQATSHMTEVDEATVAARRIFELEDRVCTPTTNSSTLPETDIVPRTAARGAIQFNAVVFTYPSRPNVSVLRGLNLTIEPGQLVALCGPSGSGKSTVVALLERFYKPLHGSISLDGTDIQTLNVTWLRSQLGLISQEPVLFAGSIHDNIAYGAKDPAAVRREDVVRAAQTANAHEFIAAFPDGYDTIIGGSGSEQLSGGQKQRVAIARAILKDPPILLLDEATSALDADSEQLVQDALEHVIKMKKRTTLVIAHRMRTIRTADKICVVANGEIVEQGKHDELLQLSGGLYAKLAENAHDDRLSLAE